MAGTVGLGNISTEDIPADASGTGEKVLEMDEKIRRLDPDDTQFTTLTSRATSRVATREKVNWLEEEDFPRIVATTAAQLSTDTTISIVAGQGKLVQGNDLLRNMRTGEGVRVVSVAVDVVTITRGIGSSTGGIAAAAVNSGDVFLVVADSQPQGSDFPTPRYLARVLGFNFTEITRTSWSFTKTTTSIELYGGREPGKEAVRKAREHKRKWEAIGFWGMRDFRSPAPPENEPQGAAGGALEFIKTTKLDANGPLTPTFFDSFLMTVMQNGSSNKVFFASPLVMLNISAWNRVGMGTQWQPTPQNIHGVKVDGFISGVYGYQVPVILKKEFGRFGASAKGFQTYGFLLDMDYIERRPLRDRDTQLLTEQQPKGKDTYAAEYLTEATYEFAVESAHGIIFGVTAPA